MHLNLSADEVLKTTRSVRKRLLLGGVLDNDKVPALTIASCGRLQGDIQTFLHQRAFNGCIKVESFKHASCGQEYFVCAEVEVHGPKCVMSE